MVQFRAKARAVELLGKGQIADLPTAILELWKNGYDAYGDKLDAHLYFEGYKNLESPFLVISDDGIGMTKDDILDKWIVLGTDSKARRTVPEKGDATLNKTPRIPTGEKGIGRLSVAYLGSQMLLLTKKKGHPLQSVFIDWRILENFNLYIDDIDIPLDDFPTSSLSEADSKFRTLVKNFKKNLPDPENNENDDPKLRLWHEQADLLESILDDLNDIEIPEFFSEEVLSEFQQPDSHGTKFIIFNPVDQILPLRKYDNPDDEDKDNISFILACLNGLSNKFKSQHLEFNNRFVIHASDKPSIDILNHWEFFSQKDFKICDHLIEASVNDEGFYQGNVRIFKETVAHTFRPNRKKGKTSYGPFQIKFGYLEAKPQNSSLPMELYRELEKKIDHYGGLYIYRDGFRVLPYGRSDFDFLKIEEQRSKGTGHYFFSYRNMFGYIEINREANKNLKDKAGREGFINNQAYRDFQNDLQAFFKDLAKKYFGSNAQSDIKVNQQNLYKQQEEEEKLIKEERKEFNQRLKNFPDELAKIDKELQELLSLLNEKLSAVSIAYEEIEELLRKIDEKRVASDGLIPPIPKRFKPNDDQRQRLHSVENQVTSFKETTYSNSIQLIAEARNRLKDKELLEEYKNSGKQLYNLLEKQLREYQYSYGASADRLSKDLHSQVESYLSDFELDVNKMTPKQANRDSLKLALDQIKKSFDQKSIETREKFEPFVSHLRRLTIGFDQDLLAGYQKIQFEDMRKQWEETRELAQLGIAVEIIDHQFNASYTNMAAMLNRLSESDKPLSQEKILFENLKSSFEHLENNYKLLTPLYRSSNRIRKEISGKDLYDYLNMFFNKTLDEQSISLTASSEFLKHSTFTFESVLKPVFINIINNAIYWLRSADRKHIHLDYIDNKLLIMNSGEPIDSVYIEGGDLFNLFFSRRPKGRGIGLYLAKSTLNSIGFDIAATADPEYNQLNGACFYISTLNLQN